MSAPARRLPTPEPDVADRLAAWARDTGRPERPDIDTVRAGDLAVLELQRRPVAPLAVDDIVIRAGARTLPARVYRPRPGPLPVLLYLHGGGFVIGPEGYENPVRDLALATGCLVVALHRRLAPEHPYPAPVEDVIAGYGGVASAVAGLGGRAGAIGLVGDSAGGNLVAVLTHHLSRRGTPPAFQILVYPMLDATADSDSYRDRAEGFGFTAERSKWYFAQYLPPGVDRRHPSVSPLFDRDIAGLPPTVVVTAGLDPLHDDGTRYVEALHAAGAPAELWDYPGTVHGFLQLTGVLDSGRRVIDELGVWIREQTR